MNTVYALRTEGDINGIRMILEAAFGFNWKQTLSEIVNGRDLLYISNPYPIYISEARYIEKTINYILNNREEFISWLQNRPALSVIQANSVMEMIMRFRFGDEWTIKAKEYLLIFIPQDIGEKFYEAITEGEILMDLCDVARELPLEFLSWVVNEDTSLSPDD